MWGEWRLLFCRDPAHDATRMPFISNRNYFFSYILIISNHNLYMHPLLSKKTSFFLPSILLIRRVWVLFYWSWPMLKCTDRKSRPSNSHPMSVCYLFWRKEEINLFFSWFLFGSSKCHSNATEVWKTYILILEFLETGFRVITSLKLLVKCLISDCWSQPWT